MKNIRRLVSGGVIAVVVAGLLAGCGDPHRDGPRPAIEGVVAPGNTVQATTGDIKMPKDCYVKEYRWHVQDADFHDGFQHFGETFEVTSLMAGFNLQVYITPAGDCGKGVGINSVTVPIAVNQAGRIVNLVPPILAGDLRAGGRVWIEPGVWDPAEVDVTYYWTTDQLTFDTTVKVSEYAYCNGWYCIETGQELTIPDHWTKPTLTVWASVGFEDYPPLVYQIGPFELGPPLEVEDDSATS